MESMVTSSCLLLLLFISTPLAFISSTSVNPKFKCHKKDSKVLLKLKKSFNNPSQLSDWNASTDCCQWHGVECEPYAEGRVTKLNIRFTDANGTISSSVGRLNKLTELIIGSNIYLRGTIPASMGKLTNLTYLEITGNNLTGPIPATLCKLSRLETLYLIGNNLIGRIPGCLGGKLINIFLGNNRLSGSIPASFLSRRTRNDTILNLEVNSNRLTGKIPASINNVKRLDIGDNQFSDVSALFGKNKKFESLALRHNKLAFNLSSVKFPLTLMELELSHNLIYGGFPKQMKELKKLASVFVDDNKLSGQITDELMELPELEEFVASSNNLSGEIPRRFSEKMLYFDVSHNKLTGEIPKQITELPLLVSFDVSYNELCGEIPSHGSKSVFSFNVLLDHNKCLCGPPLKPCL